MRSRSLLAIVLMVLSASCARQKASDGVISKQAMVKVLMEIYLAEDKVQRMGVRYDSSIQVMNFMTGRISERTGVSDSVFRRSMRYYMERPKELEAIYSALVDSLNLMEQRSSSGNSSE